MDWKNKLKYANRQDPARFLGLVGLGLELGLELVGDAQPWGWIWIGSSGLLDVAGHGVLD